MVDDKKAVPDDKETVNVAKVEIKFMDGKWENIIILQKDLPVYLIFQGRKVTLLNIKGDQINIAQPSNYILKKPGIMIDLNDYDDFEIKKKVFDILLSILNINPEKKEDYGFIWRMVKWCCLILTIKKISL